MVVLQLIDPERNRRRAYVIELQPGLFDGCSITVRWGRIHAPRGQHRTYHYSSRSEALDAARRILRRRLRHGYEAVRRGTLYDELMEEM